jgi:hypothetical protein
MGVIEDTASQILSNTYGPPPDLLPASSSVWTLTLGAGMSPGHVAIFRSINLALANCHLPAIIWCFASLTGLTILNKSAASKK